MNKEIEDALHTLLHCSLKDTEYETQFEQYKIVRDYITNLQQENKQLKSILTELEEELNIAYKELQPGELVIGQDILKNIQTLIQELKEKYK